MVVLPTVLAAFSLSLGLLGDASHTRPVVGAARADSVSRSPARHSAESWARRAKSMFDPFSELHRPTKKAQLGAAREGREGAEASRRGRALPTKLDDAETPEASLVSLARPTTFLCPADMVMIGKSYCIDPYEASLVEVLPTGEEQPWSPFYPPSADHKLRAVTRAGVFPQGYISGEQAAQACAASSKRLCKPEEWKKACMGPKETIYPYGNKNEPKRCNDTGRSPMQFFHGITDKPEDRYKWGHNGNMMDPRLNQLEGGLAHSGDFASCTNEYGVFDMVGNIHEWVDDPWGTFQGGYYLDTHLNADGCYYRTTVHPMSHADYSTGFRCCADVAL